MRIIAGKYKGRIFDCLPGKKIRPTSGRMKEAIFSILNSGIFLNEEGKGYIEDAIIADLCCGTGAFSLEALSRGASKAILVDSNFNHLKLAEENAKNIGAGDDIMLVRADSKILPRPPLECDLVFIDPPYETKTIKNILSSLVTKNWLKNNAIIIIESHKTVDYTFDEDFISLDNRSYGNSKILFLRYIGKQVEDAQE